MRSRCGIGETLPAALRSRCRDVLGVRVVDNYSSQEVGAIALECPESGLYHVQSESLIVEVLDDAGAPCSAGQIGRVVVTDLHNFATPLIRYELRDYAEVGPVCPCGRGLPTLARVLGRRRNMVMLPGGEHHWPLVGLHRYREVAAILQYQLVQHSLEEVEMRLVTAGGPLGQALEQRLRAIVQQALGAPVPHSLQLLRARAREEPGREVRGVRLSRRLDPAVKCGRRTRQSAIGPFGTVVAKKRSAKPKESAERRAA